MTSPLDRFIHPQTPRSAAKVAEVAKVDGLDERACAARSSPEPQGEPSLSPAAQSVVDALLDHWGETDPTIRREYLNAVAADPVRRLDCYEAAVAAGLARWPQ